MTRIEQPRRPTPRRRLQLITTIALLALALALGLGIWRHDINRYHQEQLVVANNNEFEPVRNFAAAASGAGISTTTPEIVKIGLEIDNIHDLSLPNQTFQATGYYWLSWPEQVQEWLDKENINSDQLVTFMNIINTDDLMITPVRSTPKKLDNGWRTERYLFSADFSSERIDFTNFPFQTISFPIRIEVNPDEFALNSSMPIALIADPRQPNLLGSTLDIPGLVLKGGKLAPYIHNYFGSDPNKPEITYSQVLSLTVFTTHPLASVGEWLIPILIVMLTVFIAPNISGKLSELRIAIPSAALLTLVVMQQGFEQTIPQLNYLTFLDLTYLWCYAVTIGLFILFVWSANQWASIDSNHPQAEARMTAMNARIDRMDRRFQIISVFATMVFMLMALLR